MASLTQTHCDDPCRDPGEEPSRAYIGRIVPSSYSGVMLVTNEYKRIGDRIEIGGPAMLHLDGTGWSGYIKNVSSRGVFFASSCPVPAIGTEVTLTCEGGRGVLARVAWVGNSGCGLTLVKPLRN